MKAALSNGSASTSEADEVVLPYALSSVRAARERLTRFLEARGCPCPMVDDARVVVSELVGNALRHARPLQDSTVRVGWALGEDGVRVAVTDGGSETVPRPSEPPMSALSGRGLSIVTKIAAEWGVRVGQGDSTVFVVVPTRR